jgi:hypothetical protein
MVSWTLFAALSRSDLRVCATWACCETRQGKESGQATARSGPCGELAVVEPRNHLVDGLDRYRKYTHTSDKAEIIITGTA